MNRGLLTVGAIAGAAFLVNYALGLAAREVMAPVVDQAVSNVETLSAMQEFDPADPAAMQGVEALGTAATGDTVPTAVDEAVLAGWYESSAAAEAEFAPSVE